MCWHSLVQQEKVTVLLIFSLLAFLPHPYYFFHHYALLSSATFKGYTARKEPLISIRPGLQMSDCFGKRIPQRSRVSLLLYLFSCKLSRILQFIF